MLHLTIHFDNGKREKFVWMVRTAHDLSIKPNKGSEHVFSSAGASVSISYDHDKEQAVVTIVRKDEETLVLRDNGGLTFRGLPKDPERGRQP